MKKVAYWIVLVALSALAVFWSIQTGKARAETEATAERLEARADSLQANVDSLISRAIRNQLMYDSLKIFSDALAQQTWDQIRDRNASIRELELQLAEALPEDMQPVLTALRNAQRAKDSAYEQLIAQRESQIEFLELEKVILNQVIGEHEAKDIEEAAQIELWRTEARRKDLNIFGLKLNFTCGLSATAGVGFKGADAVVGVGCSVGG